MTSDAPDLTGKKNSKTGALQQAARLRLTAADIVHRVIDRGQLLDQALISGRRQQSDLTPPAAALIQEMVYGCIRWYYQLDAIADQLLQRPLKTKDRDIHILLLIGLYQLTQMHIEAHTAVNTTVAAAELLNKDWAKRLLNACLRRFQREQEQLMVVAEQRPLARYHHPDWLLERLQTDWPDDWPAIVAANQARPPMTLRVNINTVSCNHYLDLLTQAGLAAEPVAHTEAGLTLAKSVDVLQLPGFTAGQVSVQDGGAQLAAGLLDVVAGQRVLDACAAPGGKTTQLLEQTGGDIALTAVDVSQARLDLIRQNLARLSLQAELVCADAGNPGNDWGKRAYDRILLDASCTATGVIRRHPDIKHHRQAGDVAESAAKQRRLLTGVWPLLKSGGKLLYATCSILREENERVVLDFLAHQADARPGELPPGWGKACPVGRQILPGMDGMDGFYYALLEKH